MHLNRYRHCIDGLPFRAILFGESGVGCLEDKTNRLHRLGNFLLATLSVLDPGPGTGLSITTTRKHKATHFSRVTLDPQSYMDGHCALVDPFPFRFGNITKAQYVLEAGAWQFGRVVKFYKLEEQGE